VAPDEAVRTRILSVLTRRFPRIPDGAHFRLNDTFQVEQLDGKKTAANGPFPWQFAGAGIASREMTDRGDLHAQRSTISCSRSNGVDRLLASTPLLRVATDPISLRAMRGADSLDYGTHLGR
jgi:hypothetical protein